MTTPTKPRYDVELAKRMLAEEEVEAERAGYIAGAFYEAYERAEAEQFRSDRRVRDLRQRLVEDGHLPAPDAPVPP